MGVLPYAQSTVVEHDGLPLICGLLETHWAVPPVMNATMSVIANFARTVTPSFRCTRYNLTIRWLVQETATSCCVSVVHRPLLYDLTETGRRLIRVMYSNIDKPDVINHIFGALTNLWFTSA